MKKIISLLLLIAVSFGANAQAGKYKYQPQGTPDNIMEWNANFAFKQPVSIPVLDSLTKKMRDSMSDATHPNIWPGLYRLKSAPDKVYMYNPILGASIRLPDSIFVSTALNAFVANAVFGGSVDTLSDPDPTVNTYYNTTSAGTFDSMGNVYNPPNSYAVISYLAATHAWSISKTPIDLTHYVTDEQLGLVDKQIIEPNISTCTGTTSAIRTYIYSVPVDSYSVIKEVKIYAATAGNIRLGEFTISGGNASLVKYQTVTLVAGVNTITGFSCSVGNYLGVMQDNTTLLGRIGFSLTPAPTTYGLYFYNVLVTSTPIALGGVTTNQRHGISILLEKNNTLNYKVNANTAAISGSNAKVDTLASKIGYGFTYMLESNVSSTSVTSNATRTYLFSTPMPPSKVINKVYIKAFTAGKIYLAEFSISGGSALRVQGIPVTVTAGVNEIKGFKCSAGNYIGVIQTAVDYLGRIAAASAPSSGYGTYVFTSSITTTTPVALPALSTNTIFGIQVELAEPNNLQLRVNNNEDSIRFINNAKVRPFAQVYLIPCYGQSLSINTNAGASTYPDSTAIYNAYDVFMRRNLIQDMNGGYVEMFNTLAKEYSPSLDSLKIMTCLGGAGGKSVLQLSKGSTYYTTVINNITQGKKTADSLGLTFNVPAIVWTQGEEDYRCAGVPSNYGSGIWNPFEYAQKVSNLIDSFNKDIKALTGQTNDIKWVMYQTGSHNAYYRYPRIAMQQLLLATRDKRVSLAKTMYDVEYNTADYVHAPAKTYRNMGNNYGIALYNAIEKDEHPLPIFPVSSYIVGTDIYIRFHVPNPPLAFDTTIVSPLSDGKYGFNLYTVTNETAGATGTIALASQTITSVSLYNSNTVKISMSALPPAGTRLTYAVNGDGSLDIDGTGTGGKSGPTLGARGNLMDSRTYINAISNTIVKLPNRCPIFEIVF